MDNSTGGAICNDGGSFTLKNSSITNSNSGYGAAIFNLVPSTTVLLINSTLANNRAQFDGGAIKGCGILSVINCTLANNSAGKTIIIYYYSLHSYQ